MAEEQQVDLTGLTQIRTEDELSGLTEEQIVRDPDSDRIFLAATPPDLGVAPAPTNVQVDQGIDTTIDFGTPSNFADSFAQTTGGLTLSTTESAIAKLQADLAQRTEALKTEQEQRIQTAQLNLEGGTTQDTRIDLFEQSIARFEVEEKINQLTDISKQIAIKQEFFAKEQIAIENKPILGSLVRGQKAIAAQNNAAEIAGLSAQAAIAQNQIGFAQSLASDYFNAAQADRQENIDRLETLLDFERQGLVNLKADERQQVEDQKSLLESVNARELNEKDAKLDLMTRNPQAWAASNISFNMPLDEIIQRISQAEVTGDRQLTFEEAEMLQVPIGTTLSQARSMRAVPSRETELLDIGGGLAQYDPISNTISYPTTDTRTDRNFNPIAISNAVPQWLEALDKAGINYSLEQGRDFGGGLKTINFGDASNGMEAAKFLLGETIADSTGADKSPFYWYKNKTGKTILDEYGINSPEQFKSLSNMIKEDIVKDIYSHEQPGGLLYDRIGGETSDDARELTTAELKAFDLPAGSTWGEAKNLNITPGQITDAEAQNTIDGIESGLDSMLEQLKTIPEGLKGTIQGRIAKWTATKERNELVAGFEAQRAIVGMMLTRLFEKGRISDADREFYMSQMPNMNQTSEAAQASATQLMAQLEQRVVTKEELSVINSGDNTTINVTDSDNLFNSLLEKYGN